MKTIMLIDDNHDERSLFRFALREINPDLNFIGLEDGERALNYFNDLKPHPDVIFLDINMPRMNGMQCLAEMKKITAIRHIPIVIYSTTKTVEHEEEARLLGADLFIQKSLNFDDICSELQGAIERIKSKM